MKKIIFGLVVLFIGSQLMTSCSSESNVLSQFSKRKYMKRFKAKDLKYNDEINERENNYATKEKVEERSYASVEAELTSFTLKEIEALDDSKMIETSEEKTESLSLLQDEFLNYSDLYRSTKKMDFNKINNRIKSNKKRSSGGSANAVVLIILCVLLITAPLAVYLFEGSITNNFWLDLILLLTIFGAAIYGLLVCFAGVSIA